MKKPFIFIINWLLILTMPLWGGITLLAVFMASAIDDDRFVINAMTGRKFLFDEE